ncbi:hypothetical protein C8N46_10874 [Kordia periserrulae]|uniref:Outer membrane protein with beta-barrel domain n=2 Tax=Kordia periserrulae TaxID=701523 RepID=A0A2T6BUM7_9FLAO|nr:hypothetical protein C8N46_10874 [Kordia periserrulae]
MLLLFIGIATQLHAQHQHEVTEEHNDGRGFRIAGIIGHTLINTEGVDNVFVPSWGLDFEYWFNHKWGIGLHNDIEIETFIIRNSDNEEIERINPLVFTIDALYHFGNGFVVTVGPGVELEKRESFYLLRVGIEYEKDITRSMYLMPNLFLDQRFDGYNTWNIGLGIGFKL